ncbi:unnamed protein product [Symbiodinium natans]|uniref:Uncharacterized protein n=1 Tax=Symbiodinium natans TaxID=878477 RepID=A0A812NBV3_9DINO|nr:unnamed protein product [Symbiodinium natans]
MSQDWDPFADPADEDLEEDDRKVTVASIDANVASTRSTRDEEAKAATRKPEVAPDPSLELSSCEAVHGNLISGAAEQLSNEADGGPGAPGPPPTGTEQEGQAASPQLTQPTWRSKGRRKGAGKGKDAGRAAWLLGLDSVSQPDKELVEGKEPNEPQEPKQVLEPIGKLREVEIVESLSAEAESTQAESPRDTDSPSTKIVEHDDVPSSTRAAGGDALEAHTSAGQVEETRIICETDPNEVLAWRELFFKLGEVEEKPSSSVAPEYGTWGEKGSLSRLLRREGLAMPEPLRDVAAGFDPDSAGSVDPDPTQGRFAPGQCLFRRSDRFGGPRSRRGAG